MALSNLFSSYLAPGSHDKLAMPWQARFFRGRSMLEIIAALAKPKMLLMAVTSGTFMTAGFLLLSVVMLVRGANRVFVTQVDEPTIPEIERHLETHDTRLDKHDERIDKLVDLINSKFDRLEEDRQNRKKDSDARYESLQHDVTYLYGGIAAICGGLALGIFKLFSADKGKNIATRMSPEDTQQLAYLLGEMRNPRRAAEREQEKDWNRKG